MEALDALLWVVALCLLVGLGLLVLGAVLAWILLTQSQPRVFISSTFVAIGTGARDAATLKEALEIAGISAYMRDPLPGPGIFAACADIARAFNAIRNCDLFVVLGTEFYGGPGQGRHSWFSTRQELKWARSLGKQIFLIKRCDEFADPVTESDLLLPASTSHQPWYPHTNMPETLAKNVRAKLAPLPRVFISVRLFEDSTDNASVQLKVALENAGVSCFLCDINSVRTSLPGAISQAMDDCELFVVLGTRGYGKQGDSTFSTREELQFAMDHRKPIFLIKRCQEFEDPLTRMSLPAGTPHVPWDPATDFPANLVNDIRVKLSLPRLDNLPRRSEPPPRPPPPLVV
jgi:hypothetical protein